jgi:hypothetical protein
VLVKLLIYPSGQLRLVIMELLVMSAVTVAVSSVDRQLHTDDSTVKYEGAITMDCSESQRKGLGKNRIVMF